MGKAAKRVVGVQLSLGAGPERELHEREDGTLGYAGETAPSSPAPAPTDDGGDEHLIGVQESLDGASSRRLVWRGSFRWRD